MTQLQLGADGWLAGVTRKPSPNADERPAGEAVSLVVVHNISLPPGRYGGGHVERLFTNALHAGEHPFFDRLLGARVSSHFFIDRNGHCTQFVSCNQRAWHAGQSSFRGRASCNDYSIGVELEGTDFEPYTDRQYDQLNAVLGAVVSAHPIEAIVGHSDISGGRKTDPGPLFDWNQLLVPPRLRVR